MDTNKKFFFICFNDHRNVAFPHKHDATYISVSSQDFAGLSLISTLDSGRINLSEIVTTLGLYTVQHVSALQRNAFNSAQAHIPFFHFTDATVLTTDYVLFSWRIDYFAGLYCSV